MVAGVRDVSSTSAFSSTAQTNFNALNAGFAMKDGVAVLTGMKIDAGTMTIDAGGALDIGHQELSLNLFPVFADEAGLNGYGLPMKLSGSWGGVKFAPDWGWLADKATAGAKARIQSEIQDELKGISGGLLGKAGYTIEFGGSAIRALSMEGRMTVCNMAIEGGARAGLVAVDDKTIDYVKGRPLAPTGVGMGPGSR